MLETERYLVVAELLIEAVWGPVVGIVLVLTTVMIVVHPLGILTSLMFGLFFVPFICTFGLGELVDLRTSKAGNKFFGEGMVDRLA